MMKRDMEEGLPYPLWSLQDQQGSWYDITHSPAADGAEVFTWDDANNAAPRCEGQGEGKGGTARAGQGRVGQGREGGEGEEEAETGRDRHGGRGEGQGGRKRGE